MVVEDQSNAGVGANTTYASRSDPSPILYSLPPIKQALSPSAAPPPLSPFAPRALPSALPIPAPCPPAASHTPAFARARPGRQSSTQTHARTPTHGSGGGAADERGSPGPTHARTRSRIARSRCRPRALARDTAAPVSVPAADE